MKIRPKNWREFQHYQAGKNSGPPWIKLHFKIIDDKDFQTLPVESRALAPMLWLLASRSDDGVLDADHASLGWRLRMTAKEVDFAIGPLIGKGFFEVVEFDAANPRMILGKSKEIPRPDKEGDVEVERENPLVRLAPDGERKVKQLRKAEALQALEFLNGKARKHFRPVAANLSLIEARLAEGITLQDLKTLIVRKCRDWLGTDMDKFLRPETLFNKTKCHSYLGEIEPEEPTCNVPDATGLSDPPLKAALADGLPLICQESQPLH